MAILELLALMIFAHALGDYGLQSGFMTQAKNRTAPIEGVPWYQVLGGHAVIHGGFVGIITGSVQKRPGLVGVVEWQEETALRARGE